MTIEELWKSLQQSGLSAQQRIDTTHPRDIYADFETPDRIGIVAVCGRRPASPRPMHAVSIERGERSDGRWTLRLTLSQVALHPVFAALCNDIVAHTRKGVSEREMGPVVLARLAHWRALLERSAAGLDTSILRGLLGELFVLKNEILSVLPAGDALATWTGPTGTAQDFLLPGGRRLEIKAAAPNAGTVRIHGLGQLDSGGDSLELLVVRMQDTGVLASGAMTVPGLIDSIRTAVSADPDAEAVLDARLASIGWHEHPAHHELAVHVLGIDRHKVEAGFPRLIGASVPHGVQEVDYTIVLPEPA